VGPGVEEPEVNDAVGVGTAEVIAGVGVGVATGVAGCVHPAARTSTTQSTRAEVITSILFIPDNCCWRVFDDCVFFERAVFPSAKKGKVRMTGTECLSNSCNERLELKKRTF